LNQLQISSWLSDIEKRFVRLYADRQAFVADLKTFDHIFFTDEVVPCQDKYIGSKTAWDVVIFSFALIPFLVVRGSESLWQLGRVLVGTLDKLLVCVVIHLLILIHLHAICMPSGFSTHVVFHSWISFSYDSVALLMSTDCSFSSDSSLSEPLSAAIVSTCTSTCIH